MRLVGLVLASILLPGAAAHTVYVLELYSDPADPAANEPFTLTLDLRDQGQFPVADHIMMVEFLHPEEGLDLQETLIETAEDGIYRKEFTLPVEGEWTLRLHDLTHQPEHIITTQTFDLAAGETLSPERIAVPFATISSQLLRNWLLLLVTLPLAAGVIVTVRTLRRPHEDR